METVKLTKIMQKRIVFIHVAKAAGSSVNKNFINMFGDKALHHCEAKMNNIAEVVENEDLQYIAGHVNFHAIKEKLGSNFYFTFLRKPSTHLYSHLNWVRELGKYYNKTRYDNHPPLIRKIADRLIKYDLTKANELKDYLDTASYREMGLYDNCQIRYFIKNEVSRVGQSELVEAKETLATLDFVGVNELQNECMLKLHSILEYPGPKESIKVNTANSNVAPYNSLNEDTIKILEDYTTLDRALYDFSLAQLREKFSL